MLARLVFSLVLGLLMYVPRPVPKPPIDTVPPTPDELPPGDGEGTVPPIGIPEIDPPGVPPIPLPDMEMPEWPGTGPGSLPSVPPTPPPGYEGEWPPASERPEGPPTPPPGHEGPWNPIKVVPSIRDGIDALLKRVNQLIEDGALEMRGGGEGAGDGAKKLGTLVRKEDPGATEA